MIVFVDVAQILHNKLWAPLGISEEQKVFVSPDGELHLLPFETLVDESGAYLIDSYQISYVGAGRDMVTYNSVNEIEDPFYVFADAAFDW